MRLRACIDDRREGVSIRMNVLALHLIEKLACFLKLIRLAASVDE